MSEARERYYKRVNFIMAANDRNAAEKDSVYIDYIIELEQQNKELREILKECHARFKQYEMDVDCDRPYHHIKFIKSIEKYI